MNENYTFKLYKASKIRFNNRPFLCITTTIDNSEDYLMLELVDNEFIGIFTVYNKEQEQIIKYLINDNIVKLNNIKVNNENRFDRHEVYNVQLTPSKKLEVI